MGTAAPADAAALARGQSAPSLFLRRLFLEEGQPPFPAFEFERSGFTVNRFCTCQVIHSSRGLLYILTVNYGLSKYFTCNASSHLLKFNCFFSKNSLNI